MTKMTIRLTVNAEPKVWEIAPGDLLLDVLRRSYRLEVFAFTLAAYVAVGVLRLPLPLVMLVLAPLSVARAWSRLR